MGGFARVVDSQPGYAQEQVIEPSEEEQTLAWPRFSPAAPHRCGQDRLLSFNNSLTWFPFLAAVDRKNVDLSKLFRARNELRSPNCLGQCLR